MAAAFYNQTKFTTFIHLLNYFFTTFKTNHSLFFLLFHMIGASEHNVIPATKRHYDWVLANPWPDQSKIKVYLTIIPWARVGYEMIDSQRGA